MPDLGLLSILLLLRTFAAPALVQQIGPDLPETAFNHGAVRFGPDARAVLHALWAESLASRQERVACIRGYRFNGVFYVTRAMRAGFEEADSLYLTPDPASCAPPQWHGTAHTHIVLSDGRPYVTFSRSDRMLMSWWRSTWRSEGAFCVLYSAFQAYCEVASDLNADATYSSRDAIEEMYYAGTMAETAPR